ncbi:MAG: zeta toxin family protein [Candidatus Paceibacterota bacterium]|jgi:uridine kinase
MEETAKIYTDKEIVEKIVDFCLGKYKFIFISGNGGSGKTTLSKKIVEEINSRGLNANRIDTDDFMIDTEIRKNAKKEWIDSKNNKRISDHGSVFKEAYHLSSLEAVVHSLVNHEDCSYKPKKGEELIELKSDLPITIIEGIASAFLEKNDVVYSILLICDLEIEVNRRIDRARNNENNLLREVVEKKCSERREQFEITVLSEKDKFDLRLLSLENHSFVVERDSFNIF